VFALPCGSSGGGAESWGLGLDGEYSTSASLAVIGNLAFGFNTTTPQAVTVLITGSVRLDATDTQAQFILYLDGSSMDDVGAVRGDGGVVAVAVSSHRDLTPGPHTLEARWIASNGGATAFEGQLHLEAIVAKAGELT